MNSGYVHSKGLGSWTGYNPANDALLLNKNRQEKKRITADEVPGNKLKLEKDVTVYIGYPGSSRTEIWKKGFLSPEVYSWVQKSDGIYWMIGELPPFRYVKHDPAALEIEAYYGGGKYLNEDENSNSFFDLSGPGLGKLDDVLKKGIIVAAAGAGIYFLTPLAPAIRNGFETIGKKFSGEKNG